MTNNSQTDFYKILRVQYGAETEEIEKSYRKLSKLLEKEYYAKSYEDSGHLTEKEYNELEKAYYVLSNPVYRSQYDEFRKKEFAIDKDGFKIPPEYPLTFNRKGCCWLGLFFAPFWAYLKGLPNAWMYLVAWLIGAGMIGGVWCCISGYREYSKFFNESSIEKLIYNKARGRSCIGWLLIGIFIIFIIRFILAFAYNIY